jgi:Kelch motif
VTFNQIEKTAPVLNYVSLWKGPSNTTFYAYGGEVSGIGFGQTKVIPPNGLWQFTPNGNDGSWSELGISSNSIFPSLTRQAAAAGASGDGAGYLLGGYNTYVPIPGIVTYNMLSGVWANNSAAGFSTYGTAQYGQMQFVPNVAENGLLVIFGGETSDDVRWYDNGSNLLSFGTIYMYDPSSNTWHNQTASGTIPESRDRFCSVGVQGDNGTFEIFMMGGHVASASGEPQASGTQVEQEQNIALDEVFVLSLPAFNWQKADYTPAFPRVDHSCNVIGKRQMVVIGGQNPATANGTALIETPDIWSSGIGIFDMTTMDWSDQYDASAADYVTPEKVKSWIQQNGPYPSTWDDPTVKGYFVRSSKHGPEYYTDPTTSTS